MQGGVVAVPHRTFGIDVDAVFDQPPHGFRVLLAHRKVQRDGVASVGTDAGRVLVQHRRGQVIAFEVERCDEVELCAGRLEHRDDACVGILLGGGGQRRRPGGVGGVYVRPEIDQKPCHRGPVLCRGVMQGRAKVLVAAHADVEKRGIVRDQALYLIGSIERNRGPEIELRPVAQEVVRHVSAHLRQRSGPAEHAELVVVPRAHDIGARLDQHLDDREVAGFCGEVYGVGIVAVVANADVGAALQ